MPVIRLPTGQLMVVPDGITGALSIPGAAAQAGEAIQQGIENQPAMTPAEKLAKIAQWVAYKDQVRRAANPAATPEELARHAEQDRARYASFLGMPTGPTPSGGGSLDEMLARDQKQRAHDELLRQRQMRGLGAATPIGVSKPADYVPAPSEDDK